MHVLEAATQAARDQRPTALVTVIGTAGSTPRVSGARMLVFESGATVGSVGGGAFEHRATQEALSALAEGCPRRWTAHLTHDLGMCCGGRMEVFIEPLIPPTPAVLFGAGHVCAALAPILVALDFQVTVVDEREQYTQQTAFKGCIVHTQAPLSLLNDVPLGARAFHLVATHDHALDQDLVEVLLQRDHTWLGLIGSRAKVTKFVTRLRMAGVSDANLSRLHAPVGLDIGAQTPAEIAVAIAAEMIRIRRGGTAAPWPLSTSIP